MAIIHPFLVANKTLPVWDRLRILNEIIAQMMLAPFEIMRIQLEAIMLREVEIARGICTKHAKELDDVYLGHVEKFKSTVRNTVNRIYKSE